MGQKAPGLVDGRVFLEFLLPLLGFLSRFRPSFSFKIAKNAANIGHDSRSSQDVADSSQAPDRQLASEGMLDSSDGCFNRSSGVALAGFEMAIVLSSSSPKSLLLSEVQLADIFRLQ
jgi:hypothetical protein